MKFLGLLILPLLISFSLSAGEPLKWLSYNEFKNLAEVLTTKVILFRDIWANDPNAEIFGGTVRDYLYWLRREINKAKSKEEAESIVDRLKRETIIDIRSFVIGDSDVDVASRRPLALSAEDYGVRKIDWISYGRFDSNTTEGMNEANQGFVPVEKLRLSRSGFVPWPGFGDGLLEIVSGNLSVTFSDPKSFSETFYAQQKENHPILLVLRYLRAVAMDYFYSYGSGYPTSELLGSMDPIIADKIKSIVRQTIENLEISEHLQRQRFVSWINAAYQKIFRSHTNPTAGLILIKHFGLDKLVEIYSPTILPFNQYLFAQKYDLKAAKEFIENQGFTESELFLPVEDYFSDRLIFHGTKTEQAFLAIMRQGIIASSTGSAGEGLYGVAESNLDFAIRWGGSRDRVVKFKIKPNARILDVTNPRVKKLLEIFGDNYEKLAAATGADIIKYPYSSSAFVVKNSEVLEPPESLIPQLRSLYEAESAARQIRTLAELIDFSSRLDAVRLTRDEKVHISKVIPWDKFNISKSIRDLIFSQSISQQEKRFIIDFLLALEPLFVEGGLPNLELISRDSRLRDLSPGMEMRSNGFLNLTEDIDQERSSDFILHALKHMAKDESGRAFVAQVFKKAFQVHAPLLGSLPFTLKFWEYSRVDHLVKRWPLISVLSPILWLAIVSPFTTKNSPILLAGFLPIVSLFACLGYSCINPYSLYGSKKVSNFRLSFWFSMLLRKWEAEFPSSGVKTKCLNWLSSKNLFKNKK